MRKLNQKQKKLLDKWYSKYKAGLTLFFDIAKCDEFPYYLLEGLKDINDFETIYQEINCYISDKVAKEMK